MHTKCVAVTNHSRGAGKRHRLNPAGAVLVLVAVGAVFSLWPARPSGIATTQPAMDDLLAAMARGDPRAIEHAQMAVRGDDARLFALAGRALNDGSWAARAAGCELLAGRTDGQTVAMLLPRVSDADGRVRMLAIGALSRVHRPSRPWPQKFAPIDDRDVWLLGWLDAYDAQTRRKLGKEICEAYAPAAHVEFGKPLAGRCLSCHAGRAPAAISVNDACAGCHNAIYDQWVRTAHAQSLSHVHLLTPNPAKGQSEWMSFGEVHGINCTECHVVTRQRSTATQPNPTSLPSRCAYDFAEGAPASRTCIRCHAAIDAEWQVWRGRPHPRRPAWPPGQVDMDVTGDERSCVDCHMVRMTPDEPRDHRWAARRDPAFLRSGVDLQWAKMEDGRGVRVTMTNLSGHAFPVGTRRRAVRLYAGAGASAELPLVLTLSADTYEGPGAHAPALAPGEQRVFDLPQLGDADALGYRLEFVRDHYNPNSYTAIIMSGSFRRPGVMPAFEGPP